eukprot:3600078-Lingulodinium_polyedra.AAC.1
MEARAHATNQRPGNGSPTGAVGSLPLPEVAAGSVKTSGGGSDAGPTAPGPGGGPPNCGGSTAAPESDYSEDTPLKNITNNADRC